MEMERRTIDFPMEVRADGGGKITGHAALFNSLSQNLGGFREQIAPGAFEESLKSDDVRMLWNHDPNFVLGRNKSGTLRMEEDGEGLRVENDPPGTQWAKDLLISIKRGDVSQMSFGFRTIEDDWSIDSQDNHIRTLKKVKLFDVSPVTYPAYTDTKVSARALLTADGFDTEKLIHIVNMTKNGSQLGPDERDFIKRSIEYLSGMYGFKSPENREGLEDKWYQITRESAKI